MTIAEFHAACTVSSIELNGGYLVTVTHEPSGRTLSAFGESVSPTAAMLAPHLARQIVTSEHASL